MKGEPMNSKWISYKGQRILYGDHRNQGPNDIEQFKAELAYCVDQMRMEPENSVLLISDMRGYVASTETVNAMKAASLEIRKYTKKAAGLGIIGLKSIFYDAIVRLSGLNARAFDDLESAQAWLVSDN